MIVLILISLFFSRPVHAAPAGSPAPSFVLNDTGGNSVRFSDYRGKVVLISFWAPWCVPCREELPALEELYGKYRKDGLEILAISVEPSPAAVSGFLRRMHLTYAVLLDNKQVSDQFDCTHLPTTIIIGRDGTVRKIHKGYGKEILHEYEQTIVELVKQK